MTLKTILITLFTGVCASTFIVLLMWMSWNNGHMSCQLDGISDNVTEIIEDLEWADESLDRTNKGYKKMNEDLVKINEDLSETNKKLYPLIQGWEKVPDCTIVPLGGMDREWVKYCVEEVE